MIFKDYYKILGLSNNKVTVEEIKQAYREQAKKYHPDMNNNFSEERFKDINEAYRILSNASSRRKYDRMWNNNIGKSYNKKQEKKTIFGELFSIFFGQVSKDVENNESKKVNTKNKKIAIKGENVETEITVSIMDAFYGKEKEISLRTIEGKMKKFQVKVPAGIRNNEKIRLIGQGKPGENGGKPGDLLIKIHIENDKKYKLNGFDLYTNLLLSPWEAALGTKVNVNTIDEEISLYIAPGTQTGEQVRIDNKGYLDGKGGRGNLIINIQIMIPKQLTKEEEELFKQLKNISSYNPRRC